MGWKNVRDQFKVEHPMRVLIAGDALHVVDVTRRFCENSPLIVIPADNERYPCTGTLDAGPDPEFNERVQELYQALYRNYAQVKELWAMPDTFENSLPLLVVEHGVEGIDFCETFAVNEVTHSGRLITASKHFEPGAEGIAALAKMKSSTLDISTALASARMAESQMHKVLEALWKAGVPLSVQAEFIRTTRDLEKLREHLEEAQRIAKKLFSGVTAED